MPGGNGTGNFRQGLRSGRGLGRGEGRGRMGGNRPGSGSGSDCVCPSCGQRSPHQRGIPCYSVTCPKCGIKMVKS